jgi:O-antigen ligase
LTGFSEHVLGFNSNANLMVIITWTIVFVVAVFFREKVVVTTSSLCILAVILCAYIVSKYVLVGCQFYPMMIVFYAMIPVFVSVQQIEIEKVLRNCMYLSFLTLPYLSALFEYQYEGFRQASMGNSYSLVSVIVPALIHFWYYRKNTKLSEKVAYGYVTFLIVCLLLRGNRGAIVSVFACIVILLFNTVKQNGYTQRQNPKKLLTILLAFVATVLLVMNMENIVIWITSILNTAGVNVPSFLLKSVTLLSQTNRGIDNGRNELYELAWQYIKQSPIYGYGIGTFAYYTDYPWVHNYLLQAMFEGGLFFAIPVGAVSLIFFLYVIKQNAKERNELAFRILLFCECIPRYLISNDPWRGTAIWLMMGYGLVILFRILHIINRKKILRFVSRR